MSRGQPVLVTTHVTRLMDAQEVNVGEDHPLAIELASLRASVARYQHEAHTVSVKLQRHSLEASEALERSHALERENARLHEEIRSLRANPDLTPHPAALQVPELTLALRRLSDKLTYTEETLLTRTNELAQAYNDLAKAQADATAAHELTDRARTREEEGKTRERDLERKARAAEEERRLADLALQEYADLVRNLEGRQSKSAAPPRQSNGSTNATPLDSLAEGRSGLQKLLEEFNSDTERLSLEISRLQAENESLKEKLEAERAIADTDRKRFAETSLELDQYKADDNTAAKMVSRYMKFSQSTIDSLQQAMESLRQRHSAAVTTLELQLDNLHKSLHSERRQAEKLRHALDELSEDLSREAFGRRREISLRLTFLTREEGLAEALRRWIRKSREAFGCAFALDGPERDRHLQEAYDHVTADAEALLETLNGQPVPQNRSPGSVARLLLAQDSVAALSRELQQETERRVEAQRRLAHLELAAEALVDGAHTPGISRTPPPPRDALIKTNGGMKENVPASQELPPIPTTYVHTSTSSSGIIATEAAQSQAHEENDTHTPLGIPVLTAVNSLSIYAQEGPTPPPKDTSLSDPRSPDQKQLIVQSPSTMTNKSSDTNDTTIPEAPVVNDARPSTPPLPVIPPPEATIHQPTPVAPAPCPVPLPTAPSSTDPISSISIAHTHIGFPPARHTVISTPGHVVEAGSSSHAHVGCPPPNHAADSTATHVGCPPPKRVHSPVTHVGTPPPKRVNSGMTHVGDPPPRRVNSPITHVGDPPPRRVNSPGTHVGDPPPRRVNSPGTHVGDPPPRSVNSPRTHVGDPPPTPAPEFPPVELGTNPVPSTIPHIPLEPSGEKSKPPGQPPSLFPPEQTHPLLAELANVKSRYDALQKAFRDCNVALKELKKDLALVPLDADAVLRTAVDRLDDYSEDARVELEIRLADEERVITGYQTLLTVPGAISDEVDESEMVQEIRMFIDGTDVTVARSLAQFTRKLDDLQHDIASVKRYMHELAASDEDAAPATLSKTQSWTSWTTGILGGSSRPVSPAPAQTFGSVMTSPRQRQLSFSSLHRSVSQGAGGGPVLNTLLSAEERENPFSVLDLRIPMPAHAHSVPPPSPSRGGLFTVGPRAPRVRVASAPIHTIGLGARSSSFGLSLESPQSLTTPRIEESSHNPEAVTLLDSDVE